MSVMRLLLIGVLALCAAPGLARGERAESPTDGLDGWAVQTRLGFGGVGGDRIYVVNGEDELRHVSQGGYSLALRLWPMRGVYVGAEQSYTRLAERTLEELEDIDPDIPTFGFNELALEAGFVHRPTPSLIVGGGAVGRFPTGTAFHTRDEVDVEAHAMVGLSFSPRWDFYFQLRGGVLRAPEEDPRASSRVGFRGGFAYQRARFFLTGYGGNYFHEGRSSYVSTGGGFVVGWEVYPGLTVSLRGEGGYTELRDMKTFGEVLGVTYTFFPDRRAQTLRQNDPRRGGGWHWWPNWRASPPATTPAT